MFCKDYKKLNSIEYAKLSKKKNKYTKDIDLDVKRT